MKLKLYFLLFIFSSLFIFNSCSEQSVITGVSNNPNQTSNFSADHAIVWMDVAYRIIADQDPNPPPPSRFYAYCCIAMYECVRPGMPMHLSLSGQLNQMPQMPLPEPNQQYDWPSVITGAMPVVMEGSIDTLFQPSISLINSTYDEQYIQRVNAVGQEIVDRSIAYGELIGQRISEWAAADRFEETRNMRYTAPPRTQNPANWEPCNPGDSAIEPYWGTLRMFVFNSPEDLPMLPPPPFSASTNSQFYAEAEEVRIAKENLTIEQKQIANFWNDKVRTGTPSGHWISIINQVIPILGLKLDKAVEVYALTAIAMADAFIYCWHYKYKFNLLRPETYIQDYMDPNWYPFLLTPAFPEYPSGHSVQSGAASEILTRMLGTVSFTDRTHNYIGYPERHFNSFYDASNEAGYSRKYGGIHYRTAIELGLSQGRLLGKYISERIRLRYTP
jgi:hypothetical protein